MPVNKEAQRRNRSHPLDLSTEDQPSLDHEKCTSLNIVYTQESGLTKVPEVIWDHPSFGRTRGEIHQVRVKTLREERAYRRLKHPKPEEPKSRESLIDLQRGHLSPDHELREIYIGVSV
jgi:hypothetical protein